MDGGTNEDDVESADWCFWCVGDAPYETFLAQVRIFIVEQRLMHGGTNEDGVGGASAKHPTDNLCRLHE